MLKASRVVSLLGIELASLFPLRETKLKNSHKDGYMTFSNFLIVSGNVSNVSLAVSTNSSIWLSLDIANGSVFYPTEAGLLDGILGDFLTSSSHVPLLLPDSVIMHSMNLCCSKKLEEKFATIYLFDSRLSIRTLPSDCPVNHYKNTNDEITLYLASASTISLQVNLVPIISSSIGRNTTIQSLLLNLKLTLGKFKSIYLKEFDRQLISPGVLFMICPNRVASLLLFAIDGFDAMIALARIILNTETSFASRHIKKNMRKLFIGYSLPNLNVSVHVYRPAVQATAAQSIVSSLAEEVTLHYEYKPYVLTHVILRTSQVRSFASSKQMPSSSNATFQLIQFFSLACDSEILPDACVLCQPTSLVFSQGSPGTVYLLEAPYPAGQLDMNHHDIVRETSLIELTSKVIQNYHIYH